MSDIKKSTWLVIVFEYKFIDLSGACVHSYCFKKKTKIAAMTTTKAVMRAPSNEGGLWNHENLFAFAIISIAIHIESAHQ